MVTASAQTTGFTRAYDSLHQTVTATYPMTQWKALDWDAINAAIRPKVVAADTQGDSIDFYTALQEYAMLMHDGHVNVRNGWSSIRAAAIYRQVGGSYGFATTRLDDGRIVASLVTTASPAQTAGMQFGATILEVDNLPVEEALETVTVLWAEIMPTTHESLMLNRCRFIGRGPVGKITQVKFLNPGSANPVIANLTAVDDGYATYWQTTLSPVDQDSAVVAKILEPSGIGYLKINSLYGDSAATVKIYTDCRDAITRFTDHNVPALILDLRVNMGGYDALAAAISGFFYDHTTLYENQVWLNPETGTLEPVPVPVDHFSPTTLSFYTNPNYPNGSLFVEPQGVYFANPLIVMTGPRAISSGEGIPMMLQKLDRCKVQSFYGSNGSFALVGYEHYLFPNDDLYFRYPYGVATDSNMRIQLDSDSTMTGGVIPDTRVPLNDSTLHLLHNDGIDVELQYAINELTNLLGTDEPIPFPASPSAQLILDQNHPNPFTSSTEITYHLTGRIPASSPDQQYVTLEVFDHLGRKVTTLVNSHQSAGSYTVTLDAHTFSPGVYFYRVCAGDDVVTRKCVKR